jgi:hypothetical protein
MKSSLYKGEHFYKNMCYTTFEISYIIHTFMKTIA